MTLRDKIMDKYWLEFLADEKGDYSTWRTEYGAFWFWFYGNVMNNIRDKKLEDFL